MPQMSPLNWVNLMFYFWILMILLISLNYFNYFNSNNSLKHQTLKINKNPYWKW
uniref:ATP synthase complex subunit 8 n=1 Tax=Passalidae sp. GENSP01 TaxID=1205571 RepID=A0A0S2MRS6_9SCAR|nr:ATP synthase F0 subunit 8 [Passalidae sp. GENSP01]